MTELYTIKEVEDDFPNTGKCSAFRKTLYLAIKSHEPSGCQNCRHCSAGVLFNTTTDAEIVNDVTIEAGSVLVQNPETCINGKGDGGNGGDIGPGPQSPRTKPDAPARVKIPELVYT